MTETDFNPEVFHAAASSEKAFLKQYVPEDDDEGVTATFERVREYKPFLSQQRNEDIYEPVDYVRIVVKGNDKLEVHKPATEQDKRRFPFAWQQYQRGLAQSAQGTPLDVIGIPGQLIAAYHAKNVFTVEDFAQVSDSNLQSLPGGSRDLRHKAREHVSLKRKADGTDAQVAALVKKNEELQGQLQESLQQNKKLASSLERLMAKLEAEDGTETPAPSASKSRPGAAKPQG